MTRREELLKLLKDFAEGKEPGKVYTHQKAEYLLLDLIDDPEITEAWNRASGKWGYL